jgi:hypothetical protein
LSTALSEVQYLHNKESRIFNARQSAYAQLHCLKKVREKPYLKEHIFRKQGLQEFKAEKQKELNTIEVESLATLVAHQLPLADFFVFNPSFLMLPDLLNGSTLIFFL